MRPASSSGMGFQFPPLLPWTRNLLVALFLLFLVEIIARNFMGVGVDTLSWYPLGKGFRWTQLFTHYLVQGPTATMRVVFGLIGVYFFLPPLVARMERMVLVEAMAFGALGGLALGLLGDAALGALGAVHYGGATGWLPLIGALVVLFGLLHPDREILLMFVLPIKGIWIVWISVTMGVLLVVTGPGVSTLEGLGAVLGPLGWWQWRGPGGRKRRLKAKASSIEKELSRFTVLDGGKDDDDDWVH